MDKQNDINVITARITASKKYRPLSETLIQRIVLNAVEKYGKKKAESEARNTLHQIWGSYYPTYPSFKKLADNFRSSYAGNNEKEALLPLLSLHASTRERMHFLDSFYKEIFHITGTPSTLLDIGCGLNPLTLPWMSLSQDTTYYAYDIDKGEVEFLREILTIIQVPVRVFIEVGDIVVDTFPDADVTFLFKMLPLFSLQKGKSLFGVIDSFKTNYLVISFPLASLSGRNVGMENFYSTQFEQQMREVPYVYHKLTFPTELVFIVVK